MSLLPRYVVWEVDDFLHFWILQIEWLLENSVLINILRKASTDHLLILDNTFNLHSFLLYVFFKICLGILFLLKYNCIIHLSPFFPFSVLPYLFPLIPLRLTASAAMIIALFCTYTNTDYWVHLMLFYLCTWYQTLRVI